jgi:signal peptidase I
MPLRHGVAGIERAESLLLIPSLLPLGFDQMKRILSATACHRVEDSTQRKRGLNRGIIVCSQLSTRFRFNTSVPSVNDHSIRPHWLRVLVIGRRPKATLVRIAVLVVVCFVTFNFILLPIQIKGISMEPTCQDRQVHCVNCLAYLRNEPQRGDIVSIRFSKPEGLANPSQMLLKRIIGLPGETVSFHGGHAYINGQLLDEPYLKLPCDWEHEAIPCGPDQYYVVGDNRSMPFNLHTKGRAERDRIIGKLFL